jgi:hypothetical protein
MPSLLVAVTNYDFHRNADALKATFERHFPTLLIDATSPRPPKTTDITVPNTYYPGLWNEAVKQAINGDYEWLLFIASDVQLQRSLRLAECIADACATPELGLWGPAVTRESRCASKVMVWRNIRSMRPCCYVEGFCFMARTHLLKQQHPLPAWNKSGWGVDVVTALLATRAEYKVCVDDRVLVHHPKARVQHQIERDPAYADLQRYCAEYGLNDENLKAFFYPDYLRAMEVGLDS